MASWPGTSVRREGGLLRTLPLVPVVAYVGLAVVMAWAYETDATWALYCHPIPYGVRCDPADGLFLTLVLTWAASAGLLSVLMGLEVRRARAGRGLDLPGAGILAFAVAVTLLGIAWLWAAEAASYGRLPYTVYTGLLMAYVTSSLFLFGMAFVDYEPKQGILRRWATVLAVVNGGFGLVLGYLIADGLLHPAVFG